MFGKGSKKPPPAPWALQFLTTDYLVTGLVAPDDYTIGSETLFYEACQNQGAEAFQLLTIASVQLQTTGSLVAGPENLPTWNLGLGDNLVAVIPNDDASRAAAQKAFSDYRQPLQAAFYAGPYVILGNYLSDPSDAGILFRDEKSLRPLANAEINCQLPGSTLKSWRVPWLLLNARQLHGYRRL